MSYRNCTRFLHCDVKFSCISIVVPMKVYVIPLVTLRDTNSSVPVYDIHQPFLDKEILLVTNMDSIPSRPHMVSGSQ